VSGKEASVSEIRQELDSTRKYVVPFMEYLDRIGFTKRDGDRRVLCESESK
jgi:selenocysteine-specific elongation factor